VLFLLLVVGGLVVVRHRTEVAALPGSDPGVPAGAPGRSTPPAGESASDLRADGASRVLDHLERGLRHGTVRQLLVAAPPGDRTADRELRTLRENVRTLGLTALSLRYVAERTATAPAGRSGTWVADVQLVWGLPDTGGRVSRTEVPVTFRQDGDRTWFVSARRHASGPTPLWLQGAVSVRVTTLSTVVTAVPSRLDRFSHLADQAVRDVRKVLTRWRGRIVVEVPRDQASLVHVLGARAGAYDEIAAVTTTADGSTSPDAPVHVFVNPRVFDPLGPRGSQIVISHEATHVATGGALSRLPVWLLEGFADYVALDHADLPVSRAASQILAQVRRRGVPAHLPGAAEFASDSSTLGASYESAWLACRLLAQEYGERRLIEFYRASDRASATTAAFRTVLGTDQTTFTRAWRSDLRRLAAGR
jgi:hypothetical protein